MLTGGNPRALIDIKIKGLEKWIEDEVIRPVNNVIEEVRGALKNRLWAEICGAVENIDEAGYKVKLEMLKHNIAIYIAGAKQVSEIPHEDWVGERYSRRIPAYHRALKLIHGSRNAS